MGLFSAMADEKKEPCSVASEDAMSTTTSSEIVGGTKIPMADRMVAMTLLKKEPKSFSCFDERLMLIQAKRVAKIATDLMSSREKLDLAEIYLEGNALKEMLADHSRGKRKRDTVIQNMNDSPTFESKIKALRDVPSVWIWAFLRKNTVGGIAGSFIKRMSVKSEKSLRMAITYLTGYFSHTCFKHCVGSLIPFE